MLLVKHLRLKAKKTQKGLGQLVGAPQPTICRLEQGIIKPSDALLARLADVLGVAPAFMLLRPVVVHEEVRFSGPDEQVGA